MTSPLISIIIPVYNAKRSLNECLNSILKQTFDKWECILVDDGSNDGSAELCDNYASKDRRFRTIHKRNGGVSLARNVGIDSAKGEWITFVDSDDWLEGDFLSFPSMAQSDSDLLIIDCLLRKPDCNIIEHYVVATYDRGQIQRIYHKLMFKQCMLGPWSKFFRRKVIVQNKIKFDQDIRWAEDRLFNLQFLSYCEKIQTVGNGYYVYNFPGIESSIMKYHPTVPMIHDLFNKMRVASLRLNAHKAEKVYLILWRTIEKVALLSNVSQEKYRKAFFMENATFRNIFKLNYRDIPLFILCAFTPVSFHKTIMYKKLGIKR